MRRSKYGYLLLALLVITGLAGTITSTSITSKERKFAAVNLKDTRNDFLNSVKNLSKKQLDFKVTGSKASIKECIYYAAISEKKWWNLLQAKLKQPANPENRAFMKLTDEEVVKTSEEDINKMEGQSFSPASKKPYKTIDDALESFKITRAEHIKYIKNTTEDLRNHVVEMPFGWIDCYQLCLVISSQSDRLAEKIEIIKSDLNFPSR